MNGGNMKKIIIGILIILVTMNTASFATQDLSETNSKKINISKISFEKREQVLINFSDKSSEEALTSLQIQNFKNIELAKTIVKLQNFENRGIVGLEKLLLDELENLKSNSSYIEDYQIYTINESNNLLKSGTMPEYYGTYNGFGFQQYFTVYTDSYEKNTYERSKIEDWVEGGLNLALNFVPKSVSIPFTVLSLSHRNDIVSYGTGHLLYYGSDQVTTKYILIQDLHMKVGINPNYYTTILVEQDRINSTWQTTYFDSPFKDPTVERIQYLVDIPSYNFYSSPTINMSRGYTQYINTEALIKAQNIDRFIINWN
jgi:hypothetical protein